ncbi:DUF4348 domain-containing protein [Parapedobacter sp. SGR-10]|uniref:DUF4348 domain-containing protein n=1 Tax=Parapedobacter sp. SGR-10 TaxID=2710879 RepID=UPI0013D569B8|nr:DUF4348 domain-containing protein [Parapedobacter sp. SGR-10]NGF56777.1 DUF4348 domain-containing protein [Parapedobacter sp. SGR-10]
MKNLFAFGFLAFALTVASCGGNQTKTEETADSLKEVVDSVAEVLTDSINTVADSAEAAIDSAANNVQ